MNRSSMLLALIATIAVSGCSSVRQTVDGWFGETPTPAAQAQPAGDPYFAGAADLPVFAEASSTSKVIGHLALHEKVIRTRLDRGYAYVTAEGSGLSGWVNNAQLIWRLPPAGSGASTIGIDPTRQTGGAANAGKDSAVESNKPAESENAVAAPEPPSTAAPSATAEVPAPATSVPDTPVAMATPTSVPPTPAAPPTATGRPRQNPSMFDPF